MKLILILLAALSAAQAEPLNAILSRMDASAKDFKGVSVNLKQDEFNAVLGESNSQSGTMLLKRAKNGLMALITFEPPDPRTIHIAGHQVEIYYPKANTVNVYDVSKYARTLDQLLLLGFGTPGSQLTKDYDIRVIPTVPSDPPHTTHLEMIPNAAELKKDVTSIELWIPEGQTNPSQEKVMQASKNYTLFVFSGVKNAPLPDSAFTLKLPPNVHRVTPQK